MFLRSEEFNNSSWGKVSSGVNAPIVTANQSLAPSGTNSADKIVFPSVPNVLNNYSLVYNFTAINTSGTNTSSIYLKGEFGGEKVYIFMIVGGIWTNLLCELTTEWQRFTFPFIGGLTSYFHIGFDFRAGSGQVAQSSCTIYAWGAQLEAGSNATSYIPTVASTVTRNADVISKTGISGLIGQTEGTLFVDCNNLKIGLSRLFEFFNLSNTSTNIFLNIASNGALQIILNNLNLNASTGNVTDLGKVILKYTDSYIKLFNNGSLIGEYVGVVSFSNNLDTLAIGGTTYSSRTINGNINLTSVWKTALTDTECINLTTL